MNMLIVLFALAHTPQFLPTAPGGPLMIVRRPPPALMVVDGGQSKPLELTEVKTDVRIVGHLAATSMTLTFFNPRPRAVEGDLYFPLPEGATVSGYALDVNGQLVDGVVVPKHEARQVFEREVRKGIDPGLVEWTQGNNFKTRIFPIPAQGSRTVRVDYVADLVDGPKGASYYLPLAFRDTTKTFALRLEAVKADTAPVIVAGGPAGLKFGAWRDSFLAETTLHDVKLDTDLQVLLPDLGKRPVQVERSADGAVYFAIRDALTPPPAPAPIVPSRLALFFDASASRTKAATDAELAALEAYFDRLGSAALTVELIVFRNAAEPPRTFALPGARAALIEALRTTAPDGGTQLGAARLPSGSPAPNLVLLLTDGLSNFGPAEPDFGGVPVDVINGNAVANHALLRYVALQNGGNYYNLAKWAAADAAARFGTVSYAFMGATVQSGGASVELYPQVRGPAAAAFTVAGRLASPEATIELTYGVGGTVRDRHTFKVAQADAAAGELLRRHWAQKKLDDLLLFETRNADAITALGREHGLVTPGTSLLVLERLEQYLEYAIRPPASLPEWRAQFDQQFAERTQIAKKAEADKLETVLKLWKDYLAWWTAEYKYPKNFRFGQVDEKEERMGHGGGMAMARGAGAPPRPTMAAPMTESAAEPRPSDEARAAEGEGEDASVAKKAGAKDDESAPPEPGVALTPWDPATPYLAALKAAPADKQWAVYLEQRAQFGTAPAFFLDCADFFFKQKDAARGLQVLSNIAELELENPALLRVLAHRLAQLDAYDLSAQLFAEALRLRPEEPQSYRDLALVLARRADARKADPAARDAVRADYARALELLGKVILGKFERFAEIELIALVEYNNILPRAKAAGAVFEPIDARLIANIELDVRIVMTWDADLTDMDLHVVEPSQEEAYYSHNRTTIGGRVSRDFTQGYGPEVYELRRAMTGSYKVFTNFFGSSAAQLIGAVTLQVDVFTHYGRPQEKRRSMTLRLTERKENFTVGEIEF